MKQKYTIIIDQQTGGLTIKEHAELSKDMFSLICEESYDSETIRKAIEEGKKPLIDTLRTPNLYPISEYIDKIAEKIITMYNASEPTDETAEPVELVFDDIDLFRKEDLPGTLLDDESVEIDDLLDDDSENDSIDERKSMGKGSSIDTSIDTSDDASHESPDDADGLS